MSGHGGGEAFLGELASAGAGDPDHGERAEAAQGVNRGRAAAIEKAGAEREIYAELGQPAASPDPMRQKRKDETGQDRGRYHARRKPPSISSGAPGNHGREGNGQEFEKDTSCARGAADPSPPRRKGPAPAQFQGLPERWN